MCKIMGAKAWLHNETGNPIADMVITKNTITIMWMDGSEDRFNIQDHGCLCDADDCIKKGHSCPHPHCPIIHRSNQLENAQSNEPDKDSD